MLNVALGGTLDQHLPEAVRHGSIHDVQVRAGSRLHAVVGAEWFPVSSYHHQAIDRLAATSG